MYLVFVVYIHVLFYSLDIARALSLEITGHVRDLKKFVVCPVIVFSLFYSVCSVVLNSVSACRQVACRSLRSFLPSKLYSKCDSENIPHVDH